jgi:hypothetical protein
MRTITGYLQNNLPHIERSHTPLLNNIMTAAAIASFMLNIAVWDV